MTCWNIIVATFDGSSANALNVRRRIINGWESPTPADVIATDAADLNAEQLESVDAVVLVVDRVNDRQQALGPLAELEESGVAVMALLSEPWTGANPYEFADSLVESQDIDDTVLCAKLQGMLHRQKEIRQLRKEIALAQRFHGGLKGEIARMHEELQLAAMVQREFLPRELPNLYGVRFAALWRPAHYVSGDIYDVVRLDDDHIGVFIADAVGHGVPAALMTMVICRSLTTKIVAGNTYRLIEPSEVLAKLNRDMIRRQGRTTRFATAAYAVVNCRNRTLRFAGAGHPPPLLLSADGAVRMLETQGGLLGVFADEAYDQIELELAINDRLVWYSDGFEQAFPAEKADAYEQRLPTERYREEFQRLCEEPTPQGMIEAISRRIDDQAGSLHQVDDLTLICMHAGPLTRSESERQRQERAAPAGAHLKLTQASGRSTDV
jgi:serine phosphatase RsbU (regulator of sigma subunit)